MKAPLYSAPDPGLHTAGTCFPSPAWPVSVSGMSITGGRRPLSFIWCQSETNLRRKAED